MNISFFIAQKLISKNESRFSKPIIKIAITAIALSLTIMLLAIAIITGFQKRNHRQSYWFQFSYSSQ